jgi:transposase InsO family protein
MKENHTHHSWVYFIKYKSEVFYTFNTFKDFVEKKASPSIKKLCKDNRGKYANQAFKDFCRELVIQHEHSFPYTPQKNGVGKRKN